jgi:hypothetical protein
MYHIACFPVGMKGVISISGSIELSMTIKMLVVIYMALVTINLCLQ